MIDYLLSSDGSQHRAVLFLLVGATVVLLVAMSSSPSIHYSNSSGTLREALSPIDTDRFIVVLGLSEGLSGWVLGLKEVFMLANLTGRKVVTPCVSAGRVVLCSPHILRNRNNQSLHKDEFTQAISDGHFSRPHTAEDVASLDSQLTRDPVDCTGNATSRTRSSRHIFPLHAYFDERALASYYGAAPALPLIPFSEWAALRLRDIDPQQRYLSDPLELTHTPHGQRYAVPYPVLCVSTAVCTHANNGDTFVFPSVWVVDPASIYALASDAEWHDRRELFVVGWMRQQIAPSDAPLPRFNPLHYTAVRLWVNSLVGVPGDYAAFQWRSEEVPPGRLDSCAATLARQVHGIFPSLINRSFLVTDMAGPANPCLSWRTYKGGGDAQRRSAVARLLGLGMRKYDVTHAALDSGVLAIRDYILAAEARWYVTCAPGGDEESTDAAGARDADSTRVRTAMCRYCSRYHSSFVRRVIAARAGSGGTMLNWAGMTREDVVPAMSY